MKALILVGGYGTRLRPLTFTKPKPLVDFVNAPMILHQIKALVEVGVTEVVLAVNYQPEVMLSAMHQVEEKYGVKITFSIESEPLGTAGPLRLASEILTADGNQTFFVLNSDVICEFPFKELLEFHLAHNGEGTLMTTTVEDPSKYGVILSVKDSTLIDKFVEKPKDYVGNAINAGIYIFNTSILSRIPEKPTSIEKEIFPPMAAEKQLHSIPLKGFWADVGQPRDFLTGTALYLESLRLKNPSSLQTGKQIIGNVIIDPTAKIGNNCKIGPDVTIGPKVVVGDGVRLKSCVLMRECQIKDNAWVNHSIIGWYSSVGRWARVDNVSVLGEDVHVKDEVFVNGGSVLPHKSVGENIMEPRIVIMAEVEETIKRLAGHKGVEGIVVVNMEGIPIRTTLDHERTVQHAALLTQLTAKAKSVIRDLDPQNDLTFLRIRSKKHEIMVAPDKDYILIVLQNPQKM